MQCKQNLCFAASTPSAEGCRSIPRPSCMLAGGPGIAAIDARLHTECLQVEFELDVEVRGA